MKKGIHLCLSAIVLAASSGVVLAQDYDFHPALSDNFLLGIGAFRSDNAFKIRVDGREGDIGDNIDFEDAVGVDGSSTIFNGQLRWKFGKKRKWSLWGQYFSNDATGDATLTEDVDFEGITFRAGTFVESGVKLAVTRLFIGRSFVKNEQHDFGAGIGIHNLDLNAYIGGEIRIDDVTTGYTRADAGGSQILPNIGAWYNFSPAKKWLLHGRLDWISADIGNYDGTMWNTSVGVNYQAFRHVGFDLSYQYFDIDLKVTETDLQGEVNMKYSGPVLSLGISW